MQDEDVRNKVILGLVGALLAGGAGVGVWLWRKRGASFPVLPAVRWHRRCMLMGCRVRLAHFPCTVVMVHVFLLASAACLLRCSLCFRMNHAPTACNSALRLWWSDVP